MFSGERGTDWGPLWRPISVAVAFSLIIVILMQRQLSRGMNIGGFAWPLIKSAGMHSMPGRPGWFRKGIGLLHPLGPYSVPAWAEPTAELGTVESATEWYTHNPYSRWCYNTIRLDGSAA